MSNEQELKEKAFFFEEFTKSLLELNAAKKTVGTLTEKLADAEKEILSLQSKRVSLIADYKLFKQLSEDLTKELNEQKSWNRTLASEKGKSIESIREMFSGCGTEEEVCREYFENFDDNEAIPCCTKYTYRYLWCIHAIIWAIEQWDIMNIERGIGEHD